MGLTSTTSAGSFVLSGDNCDHPVGGLISDHLESFLAGHPACLDHIAVRQAQRAGGGGDGDSESFLTFRQLNAAANQMARVLVERVRLHGRGENSDGDLLVAMRFLPAPGLVAALLAVMKAGLAYLPVAPNWPELRVRHILAEARPVLILTNLKPDIFHRVGDGDSLGFVGCDPPDVLQYDDLLATASHFSMANLEPGELALNGSFPACQRLLAVLYTSGSTGTPKGVRLLHSAALNRLGWYWRTFPYQAEEVCVFKTTLTFVDSITEIWSPLLRGHQVVVFPRAITQNVAAFVEALDRHRIGRVYLLTGLMRSILAYVNLRNGGSGDGRDSLPATPTAGCSLAAVKLWELTAEAVTKEVLLNFFAYFTSGQHVVSNFYGSTETMDVVVYQTFRPGSSKHDFT
jgi:non-ribosomal peptide synthetase component F